jgi:WD40 repeat protein
LVSDRGRSVNCLAFSPDGELIGLGSPDGSVRVWNAAKRERVGGDRPAHAKGLGDLCFSPDKKTLVTGDEEGEVKVWDLAKPEPLLTFKAHPQRLLGLAMSADGKRFASLGRDGEVRVWETATGKSVRQWELKVGVQSVLFLPDGKQLATANADGTVYLLELP